MSTIKTAAIICEYNPFHNGHKFLIEKIKKEYADAVICIMSGNFVQRGDISIIDKYTKTEYALQNGADLVIELPCVYANSSAQIFSRAGVEIAKSLNCDYLCFGTENATVEQLNEIIDLIESEESKIIIKEKIDEGFSYPKALDFAISSLSPNNINILRDSNNILAIEYIKALEDSNIKPISIQRKGVSHDSETTRENIASASFIRDKILTNGSYENFTQIEVDNPAKISNIEKAILFQLKTLSKERLSQIADVSEGIENRLYDAIKKYNSIEEIISNTKTKRYTEAKIRRLIISAFLGITNDMQQTSCPYVRVLGMNNIGATLLKKCTLPLIINLAADIDKLSDFSKDILNIDVKTSEIYSLATNETVEPINEYTKKIIKH